MTGPALSRRLGTVDAVALGLGSMIGAGIFAAFAPAAAAAGAGLLVGLVIAAVIAFCNATSSAQLAAQYPTSGGTYIYGREQLGEWPGFLAGWCFVIGKTASCAAMALTAAAYAVPEEWAKPVGVAAVLVLATVNCFGVTRTAALTKLIVVFVLAVLVIVIAVGLPTPAGTVAIGNVLSGGWYGILQSAGLLFFAFAGYARIATMGEEVRDPGRTIPRAIIIALSIVLVLYALVAVALVFTLGPVPLASSRAPLTDLLAAQGVTAPIPLVRAGAAVAALGALLALVAGIGRTTLAMARHSDLPAWLGAVHPRYRVPHHAEIALALVVSVLVLTIDLRGAIGFSSFGVLLYYFVANVSAFTQQPGNRRYPKALQVLGASGCLVLVATLPPVSIVAGLVVVAAGVFYRLARLRRRPARRRD
ncbi:amino acid permease [Cryobacterium tepidiphilum]|uniref:Amino acid permease n=1 Tax=Cryobacterium tepidiphilum TaxID=2486026 RepID=A0A3M8LF52_9MICO|nr:amino acid permease [Cryobacterium tepidiphilum]